MDRALFERTQRVLAQLNHRMPEPMALERLRALYQREGRLSSDMLDAEPGLPSARWYREHFKGLYAAYAAVGFTPARDGAFTSVYRNGWHILARYRRDVGEGLAALGATVEPERRIIMRLGGRLRLGVLLSRFRVVDGRPRWVSQIHVNPLPHWMLVGRLAEDASGILDHTLVPGGRQIVMLTAEGVGLRRSEERYADLDEALRRVAGLAAMAT